MSNLLVLGATVDPHIRAVCGVLAKRGINCLIYDPIFSGADHYEIHSSGNQELIASKLNGDRQSIQLDEVTLAWWRLKYFDAPLKTEQDQIDWFSIRERVKLFEALVNRNQVRIFNPTTQFYVGTNKATQLERAAQAGFLIPKTLISSSKLNILNAFASHDRVVVKPFNKSFIPAITDNNRASRRMMANEVGVSELSAIPDEEFEAAPVIFQETIRAKCEHRLIAFGDHTACYKILAPPERQGQVDWRKYEDECHYELVVTPDHIQKSASKYLRLVDLNYGVFDLIEKQNGDVYFLECNADGQWMWLESETDTTVIREALAAGIMDLFLESRDKSQKVRPIEAIC